MSDEPLLALAEFVASTAAEVGIETAIIGGWAMALRGTRRPTSDFDLGAVSTVGRLWTLSRRLEEQGLKTELRTPDDDDDLDGVLDVWETEIVDAEGETVPEWLVQVVNFKDAIGLRAISNAEDAGSLRLVQLEDLVLLKLAANGIIDRADARLLLKNKGIDLERVRAACRQYRLEDRLEPLLKSLTE